MRTVPLYPPPELGNSRRGLITPVRSSSLARSLAAVAALCAGMLALCWVPPVNAQDDSVPAQRTATVVTRNSVTFIWDDPGDESITHYRISRRDLANHAPGEFVVIDDNTGSAATSYTDDTVEPGGSYLYRITALNRKDASQWSRYARADIPAASTRNAPPPWDGSVPDRPTGLSTIATFNSVTLIWDNPGDSTIIGYVILRRNIVEQDPGVFTTVEANTSTVTMSYTDNGVEAETRYAYWIKAINEHGISPRSDYVNVETPAAPRRHDGSASVTDSDRASVSEGDTDLPNDNTTPGRVAVGGAATGTIEIPYDQDRFAVDLEAGRTYRFDLTGSPGGGGTLPDTYFRGIYNSKGRYQSGSYNDDFEGSRDSRVTFTPTQSGTYYAQVSGNRDEVGSYTLSFTDVTPELEVRGQAVPEPTGFEASNGNEQVTLTWDAPLADADVARHEYRFKTTGDYPAAWKGIDDSAPGGLHEDWV